MRGRCTGVTQKSSNSIKAGTYHVYNLPPPQKKLSLLKSMLTVSVEIHRVVHYEFVPQGQTVNHHYTINTTWHLQEKV